MAEERKNVEELLKRLEQLVREMESGTLPLDAMMNRFEEGRELVATCATELEAVRRRIEKVVKPGVSGQSDRVEALKL